MVRHVTLFMLVVLVSTHALDGWACSPPPQVRVVEATAPAPDATDVPIDTPILFQLRVLNDWSSPGFLGGFEVVLRNADGAEVVRLAQTESFVEGWEVVQVDPGPLEPQTEYVIELVREGQSETWSFTTGAGPAAPFDPGALTAQIRPDWGSQPVYDCCPEQFVGECPNCGTIGTDPVPMVRATFDALDHVLGLAAWTYTLQQRRDGAWNDVGVGPFADREFTGQLEVRDSRLINAEYCYRVVAQSAVDPQLVVEGDETCIAPDAFGARPDPVRHDPSLECAESEDPKPDEDPEEPVDEDLTEDEPLQQDDDPEVADDEDTTGWELSEQEQPTSRGCCSTHADNRDAHVVAFLLAVVALAFGGRRRRRGQGDH